MVYIERFILELTRILEARLGSRYTYYLCDGFIGEADVGDALPILHPTKLYSHAKTANLVFLSIQWDKNARNCY